MTNERSTLDYLKYAFILVAVGELCCQIFGLTHLNHFTKPLLMPLLLVYFRKGTTGSLSASFMWAMLALLFSFVGDSLLMYQDKSEIYFLLGLGAFAIAQLSYVVSFSKAIDTSSSVMPLIQKLLYALPFVGFVVGLLWMLWPNVGELKIPIIIYASLITSMALSAVYRNGRTLHESARQVIKGAVFFVLSDTLLALNKFHQPMENAGLFIMITYILAQWNIINGLQKHYNAKSR